MIDLTSGGSSHGLPRIVRLPIYVQPRLCGDLPR
jgi:hypothetical protein